MGRDKALLPYRGGVLAQYVADCVNSAAGSAQLVGNPELYGACGYPVIADRYPGEGPLGGILTALDQTTADWNLIVACDMPELSVPFLSRILTEAEGSEADVLLPIGPTGRPEPLCAVYHRRSLAGLQQAFAIGQRKITAALANVRARRLPLIESSALGNVNSPEDWLVYAGK
jgi:molybdopterin-guanine dinucleotide biosynthesis protein A